MQLSEIGKMVEQEWIITPELRPDMHLKLGVFQVRPNHFHAIIINKYNQDDDDCDHVHGKDTMHCVFTDPDPKPNPNKNSPKNKFGPQSKNLASIMRGWLRELTNLKIG